MAAYLTPSEAMTRLFGRFGIEASLPYLSDLEAASRELDSMGPFIGGKLDSGQEGQFPRDANPDGTTNDSEDPPDAILDAVALLAHGVASDEAPAIKSESVMSRSVTYATARMPLAERRVKALVKPYQRKRGTIT